MTVVTYPDVVTQKFYMEFKGRDATIAKRQDVKLLKLFKSNDNEATIKIS